MLQGFNGRDGLKGPLLVCTINNDKTHASRLSGTLGLSVQCILKISITSDFSDFYLSNESLMPLQGKMRLSTTGTTGRQIVM